MQLVGLLQPHAGKRQPAHPHDSSLQTGIPAFTAGGKQSHEHDTGVLLSQFDLAPAATGYRHSE